MQDQISEKDSINMPNKRDEGMWLNTGSLMIIAIVALAVALIYTRGIMIPFVMSVFIALSVSPILDFQIIRLKFPRIIAVAVTLFIVVILIVILCFLIFQATQTIVATIGSYSEGFGKLADGVFRRLQEWGINVQQEQTILDFKNKLPGIVTNAVGPVVGMLSSVFLVLIFVAFLLAGRNPYAVRSGVRADIDQNIRRYIVIKVAISAVTGFFVWVTLGLIKLKLAGVFGILAFLLNFIPSIGSIIATLLPIPIAAAQFQSPWPIVYVIAIPGVIQTVIGNIVDPKIMGDELNLHPITVLLALAFWGLLWGVIGMFLATPITAVIRIVLMQFDTLKPVGKLLAGDFSAPETQAG
jgi:AI-2 transport protein TqsA